MVMSAATRCFHAIQVHCLNPDVVLRNHQTISDSLRSVGAGAHGAELAWASASSLAALPAITEAMSSVPALTLDAKAVRPHFHEHGQHHHHNHGELRGQRHQHPNAPLHMWTTHAPGGSSRLDSFWDCCSPAVAEKLRALLQQQDRDRRRPRSRHVLLAGDAPVTAAAASSIKTDAVLHRHALQSCRRLRKCRPSPAHGGGWWDATSQQQHARILSSSAVGQNARSATTSPSATNVQRERQSLLATAHQQQAQRRPSTSRLMREQKTQTSANQSVDRRRCVTAIPSHRRGGAGYGSSHGALHSSGGVKDGHIARDCTLGALDGSAAGSSGGGLGSGGGDGGADLFLGPDGARVARVQAARVRQDVAAFTAILQQQQQHLEEALPHVQ